MKNSASRKQKAASRDSTPASCLLPPARSSGFTLIEALVAIAILTISVAGPLVTASRAIVAAQNTSNQLTATYLAQEGIEDVRAMRDDAYLYEYSLPGNSGNASALGWSDFASVGTSPNYGIEKWCTASYCSLDPIQSIGYFRGKIPNNGSSLSSGNVPLYLTNISGADYLYTTQSALGGAQTPFTRVINIMHVSSTDELVISSVTWSFHGVNNYSVTMTDHLTPWQ